MRKVITISLFAILFAFVANSVACYAAGSVDLSNLKDNDEALMKRALATAAINCYENVALKNITVNKFDGKWKNIFLNKNEQLGPYNGEYINPNTKYALAPMFNSQHKLEKGWIGCQEAFEGGGSGKIKKGLSEFYAMPTTLEEMGYVVDDDSYSEKDIYTIKFTVKEKNNSGKGQTSQLQVVFDKDGNPSVMGTVKISDDYFYKYSGGSKPEQVRDPDHKGGITNVYSSNIWDNHYQGGDAHEFKKCTGEAEKCIESFATSLKETINILPTNQTEKYYSATYKTEGGSATKNSDSTVYKKDANSAKKMLKNIGFEYGVTNRNGTQTYPTWDDDAKYSLYLHALVGVMKKNKGDVSIDCDVKDGEGGTYFFYNKKDSKCYINITPEKAESIKSELVNIVPKDGTALIKGKFSDALKWLKVEHPGITKYLDANEAALEAGEISDGDDVEGEKDEFSEACSKQAQSLGWIICPVIKGLKNAVGGIYGMVEPMIRVSDGVLEQLKAGNADGNGPTYEAWSFFRNIANVIFVILFLVIIFSQLTGYGIDNYGIKKMLPKIIVTAILVNLSFIICAVMIDISNVVGKAIQDLFMTMGEKVDNDIIAPGEGSSITGSVNSVVESVCGIVTVVGSGALALNGIGAVATGGFAIIIPVLLFLVSAVIAVLFALAILGIRQALVIVLIVVSPIVFACTLLPNTEKLFKNWKDLFVKILTVYPIVSALIGAGYFTAKILYTEENDLFMGIVAGTLLLGPYFAVPTLVKKSLAAAGNIGALLSSKGDMLRGRVKNYGNSEKIKDIRERSKANSWGTKLSNRATMAAAEKFKDKKGKVAWLANHTIASTGRLNAVTSMNKARVDKGHDNALRNALNSQYYGDDIEAKMNADEIKNFDNQIVNGHYVTSDGAILNKNDTTAITKELENELRNPNGNGNKVRALQNALFTYGGKKGTRALATIAQDHFEGKMSDTNTAMMKEFYDNIKNSHGGEIDSMPILREAAIKGSVDGTTGGTKGIDGLMRDAMSSMNAEQMSKMDKEDLGRYESYIRKITEKGIPEEEDRKCVAKMQKLAQESLTNNKLSSNIKDEDKMMEIATHPTGIK